MDRIALFPIKNVLFPDSVLPVHVFEGRYIQLMKQVKNDEVVFGINLKESGKVHEIGCFAEISDIMKNFDDGRMDILLKGSQRYRILNKEVSEIGYLTAEIETFEDIDEEINFDLLIQSADYYNKLVSRLKDRKISKLDPNKLTQKYPSFHIAQKSGLNVNQKYELISLISENKRLEYLLEHYSKIYPMIKEAEFVSKIIKNDGYYTPKYLD